MKKEVIITIVISAALLLGALAAVFVSAVFFNNKSSGEESALLPPEKKEPVLMYPALTPSNTPSFDETPFPSSEPTANPIIQPSAFPSGWPSQHPTFSKAPTGNPTISPTNEPSISPTLSTMPSMQPSQSAIPSTQPSMFPSISAEPSNQPSMSPTVSSKPSSQPSSTPSSQPSLMPSSQPSTNPTVSTSPSGQPSLQPTTTSSPSSMPSQIPTISTSPSNAPSSQPTLSSAPTPQPSFNPSLSSMPTDSPTSLPSTEPSLAPSETKLVTTTIVMNGENGKKPMAVVGAACFLILASAVVYVSRNYKRLKGGDEHDNGQDTSNYDAEKMSVNFDGDTDDMVDIDLEGGQADSSVDVNNHREKGVSSISKLFNRKHTGGGKQNLSWMEIRDEGSPACSSGCAPVKGENSISSLSPRLSPMRNIASMRVKMQSLVSISSDDTDDLPSVDGSLDDYGDKVKFVVSHADPGTSEERTLDQECKEYLESRRHESDCASSPSVFSGLEENSPGVPASRYSFEENVDQLKNILSTIKSLGSYEESVISDSSAGISAVDFRNRAISRLGLTQEQSNDRNTISSSGGKSHYENKIPRAELTYGNELLSTRNNGDNISFRDVYFHPKNEVYQCRVASGPLGIVVEATQVGLRVQKINPMSPFCNEISVGDTIIGVDEVDVVGAKPDIFWQLVSRRANKQHRCFVLLRN